MATVTGTQTIPSEDLDNYRGLLTEKTPNGIIRRRYPYRLPKLQNIGGNPSDAQLEQRSRFRTAIDKFAELDSAGKSRWYAAEPVWGSFLWYYDYFILSALMSVTGLPGGAIAVIKGIHYYAFTIQTGNPADITINITAVDPNKAVCMLFGAGFNFYQDTVAVACYPYPKSLGSSVLIARGSIPNVQAAECGALVIEYI